MAAAAEAQIGVIGGSGLYDIPGLTNVRAVDIETPYGNPSDSFMVGEIEGVGVAFLPRHMRGHRLLPSELPSQANIHGFKELGVSRIISVSAVGSLEEAVAPRDLVVPDQLIDNTTGQRPRTFFGDGVVAHVALADPFCPDLRTKLTDAARQTDATVHPEGSLIVIEGPQFSTRAESQMYRRWGATIIGMTALPEARLAREAELCYATLALSTDYDSWHAEEEPVTMDMIIGNMQHNVQRAIQTLALVIPTLVSRPDCQCATALDTAIVTPLDEFPHATRERLQPIISGWVLRKSDVTET